MKLFNFFSKSRLRLLATMFCLASASSLQAATLVWGSGKWGDTWAAGATGGGGGSNAPQTIPGTSFHGQSDPVAGSTASFALGLTRDNGVSYVAGASVRDSVKIVGYIKPEAQHIGQLADIFVVDRVNLAFTMKNLSGIFVTWDGRVPDLVPFREDVVLSANLEVDIFTGILGISGDHRMFLGYMTADGVLRYTPTPLRLDISE